MLGFLSPNGDFINCKEYSHISTAERILTEHLGYIGVTNAVDTLCSLGWVVIQNTFVGFASFRTLHFCTLTEAQRDFIEQHWTELSTPQKQSYNILKTIVELEGW